jgi:hypothetical protein
MTETPTPDEDELVSRVLDGDATDEERTRVDGDPRLRARLQAFQRVQTALVDVEPAAADARDAAVTRALGQGSIASEPVRLHLARERRRRRIGAIVAIAAALLIAVPLLAIAFTGRGSEQKSASSADATASGAPNNTAAPLANADSAAPALYAGDLGGFETDAQLRSAVAGVMGGTQAAESGEAPQLVLPVPTSGAETSTRSNAVPADLAQSCASALATTEPALGTLELTATATWQGTTAVVAVYRGASDVIVILRDDCTVVARVVP